MLKSNTAELIIYRFPLSFYFSKTNHLIIKNLHTQTYIRAPALADCQRYLFFSCLSAWRDSLLITDVRWLYLTTCFLTATSNVSPSIKSFNLSLFSTVRINSILSSFILREPFLNCRPQFS